MEEAIKSYLRQEDQKNRYQEGYQSKLKIYREKVERWEDEKGDDYWEERNRKWALFRENFHTTVFLGNLHRFIRNSSK